MNSPKTPSLFCSAKYIEERAREFANRIAQNGAIVGYRIPHNGFSIDNPLLKNGLYFSIPNLEYSTWLLENGFEQNDVLVESKIDVRSQRAEIEEFIRRFVPTFVVNHFVQAEEISRIASNLNRRVGFEIEIQNQHGLSGVSPGPDALELKKGIEKLPAAKWVGFHFKTLQQQNIARKMLINLKSQSTRTHCTILVNDNETLDLDEESPFSCYLIPTIPIDNSQPDLSYIKTSIISRPKRNVAIINLGTMHFQNGPILSDLLTEYRNDLSSDWVPLQILSVAEYEMGIEIPAEFGNILIGDQIEIAINQPRACLLPIQFV